MLSFLRKIELKLKTPFCFPLLAAIDVLSGGVNAVEDSGTVDPYPESSEIREVALWLLASSRSVVSARGSELATVVKAWAILASRTLIARIAELTFLLGLVGTSFLGVLAKGRTSRAAAARLSSSSACCVLSRSIDLGTTPRSSSGVPSWTRNSSDGGS